jgi:hypothetical protein
MTEAQVRIALAARWRAHAKTAWDSWIARELLLLAVQADIIAREAEQSVRARGAGSTHAFSSAQIIEFARYKIVAAQSSPPLRAI